MARFTIDDIYNCPFCDSEKVYKLKDNKTYKCANNECYKKFTVTSRTYLDNTKLPPYKIARYCYLIAEMKIINSCVISRDLGVTQKTAWYLVDLARKVARNNNQDVLKFKDISDFMELLLLVVKS